MRVEIVHRQVEPPGDERARPGTRADTRAVDQRVAAPGARDHPSNGSAASARGAELGPLVAQGAPVKARTSATSTAAPNGPRPDARAAAPTARQRARRGRRAAATPARPTWRSLGGRAAPRPHAGPRRRRPARPPPPRPPPPAPPRRPGSAGCPRSRSASSPRRSRPTPPRPGRSAARAPPSTTAPITAAISAGQVRIVAVSAETARTGIDSSFALPGDGTPRAVCEAPSAPPAPITSGPEPQQRHDHGRGDHRAAIRAPQPEPVRGQERPRFRAHQRRGRDQRERGAVASVQVRDHRPQHRRGQQALGVPERGVEQPPRRERDRQRRRPARPATRRAGRRARTRRTREQAAGARDDQPQRGRTRRRAARTRP